MKLFDVGTLKEISDRRLKVSFEDKTEQKELIRQMVNTWLSIKQRIKVMLSEMQYDLTFEQIMVIHMLVDKEGLNLGAIAKKADRERTTISRMVDGLERRNLVVRVPDKTDRRQKLLYLTPMGKARVSNLTELGENFHREIYEDINDEEVRMCLSTLKKMLENLEKN